MECQLSIKKTFSNTRKGLALTNLKVYSVTKIFLFSSILPDSSVMLIR